MDHTKGQAVVEPTQQNPKDVRCHDTESGLKDNKVHYILKKKDYLAVKQRGDNPFVAWTNSLRDIDGGQRVREAAGEADEEDSGVERYNQIFL